MTKRSKKECRAEPVRKAYTENKILWIKISSRLLMKMKISLISIEYQDDKQLIYIRYKKNTYKILVNLIGKIQLKNIFMAMLAAEKSNLVFKKIVNSIRYIKPVRGRLEKIGNIKNNSKVILDYAHTPDALKACLLNLKEQFADKKISIVFGCGGNRDKGKRAVMGMIANQYCEKIYLTDDNGNTLFGFNRVNTSGDPLEILPFTVTDPTQSNILITQALTLMRLSRM